VSVANESSWERRAHSAGRVWTALLIRSHRGAMKNEEECQTKILKKGTSSANDHCLRTDAIKTELDELRERADAAGFDLGATLQWMSCSTTCSTQYLER
jgi:hypothetical protein